MTNKLQEAASAHQKQEHALHQAIIRKVTETVLAMDLDAHLRRLERAEAMGPIMDPSLWMAGREALAVEIQVTRALVAFKKSIGVEGTC